MRHETMRTGRAGRALPLAHLSAQTAGEAIVAALRQRTRGEAGLGADFHARAAQRYADHLGRSKGVLMKAGQVLSFTSVGSAVTEGNSAIWRKALARLQDSSPPMPIETVVGVVESEFGLPLGDLFASFDTEPLAAASIGQVHAARTRTGREVVVKVQYPGVDTAIRADLRNTELLVTFFQLIRGLLPDLQQVDPQALAREVADRIGEELDYRTEAANQRRFADAYRAHPFIRVPEVLTELSSPRVLTTERAAGRRFAHIGHAPRQLKDQWGETIVRFALGSLRRLRAFHADPHPGNYLFNDDGSVTFLDFGCVKRFTEEQVRSVVAMLDATANGDATGTVVALIDMGVLDPANLPAAADVLAWQQAWLSGLVTAEQPFTHTPETAARAARCLLAPTGPFRDVVTRAGVDSAYVMLTRINLGVNAVLGELRATGPWERIRHEWDHNGEPATTLGALDLAYWRDRA